MKTDYPIAFLEAWKEYPRREPDNPRKPAFKAWQARVNEGIPIATLLAATKGYAASIRQRRLEGTEKVMMAATFYGCNERYVAFVPQLKVEPGATARNDSSEPKPVEERIDGRPFLREIIAKLSGGMRQIP